MQKLQSIASILKIVLVLIGIVIVLILFLNDWSFSSLSVNLGIVDAEFEPPVNPTTDLPTTTQNAITPEVIIHDSTVTPQSATIIDCPSLEKGESRLVNPGTFIQGDIFVNGEELFRQVDNEGTVAYFEIEAYVEAPWGAGCREGSIDFIDYVVQQEIKYGCGDGCETVQKVVISEIGVKEEIISAIVEAVVSSTPEISPLISEYPSLGSNWTAFFEDDISTSGLVYTLSHYPLSSIRYIDVTVDDELEHVELVCHDTQKDIRELFSPLIIEGEVLPHYQSERIEVQPGCRIDFTIKDILGVKISIKIISSPAP